MLTTLCIVIGVAASVAITAISNKRYETKMRKEVEHEISSKGR